MGRGPAKKATASKAVIKRKRKVITPDGSEEEVEETHAVKKARVVGGVRKRAAKKANGAKKGEKQIVDAKRARSSGSKRVANVGDESESDSGEVVVLDDDKAEEDLDLEDDANGDGDENEDGDGDDAEGQENRGGDDEEDGEEGDDEVRGTVLSLSVLTHLFASPPTMRPLPFRKVAGARKTRRGTFD